MPTPEPDGLPETWTSGARDTFEAITEEHPDLSAAGMAALFHACTLESNAERLDAVALVAGMVAKGSTGQTIVHPAVTEARLARTAAAQILGRLGTRADRGSSSASARASRAARARWDLHS